MDINAFQSDSIVSKQLSYPYPYFTSTGIATLTLAFPQGSCAKNMYVEPSY